MSSVPGPKLLKSSSGAMVAHRSTTVLRNLTNFSSQFLVRIFLFLIYKPTKNHPKPIQCPSQIVPHTQDPQVKKTQEPLLLKNEQQLRTSQESLNIMILWINYI